MTSLRCRSISPLKAATATFTVSRPDTSALSETKGHLSSRGVSSSPQNAHIDPVCTQQFTKRRVGCRGEEGIKKGRVWVDLHRCREGICTLVEAQKRKTIRRLTQRTRMVRIRSTEKNRPATGGGRRPILHPWGCMGCLRFLLGRVRGI